MDRRNAHVESIVGPLRASDRCKDRMREELLDHLVAATDAAAARSSADPIAEAIGRLGPAGVLRADLQAAVPALERAMFTRVGPVARYADLFGRDPARDRTPLRYAARRAHHMAVLILPFVVVTMPLVESPDPSAGAGVVALIFAAFGACTFASFWLLERLGLRARLHVRSATPAGVQALILLGFGLFLVGTFLGAVHLAIPGGLHPAAGDWVVAWTRESVAMIALVFALVAAMVVNDLSTAKRRYARWGTVPGLPD